METQPINKNKQRQTPSHELAVQIKDVNAIPEASPYTYGP